MSMPYPLLTAVLDDLSDDVIDFIDSHDPSDFTFYESEELSDDVMDLIDQYEVDLIAAMTPCADCDRGQCAPHRRDF